jgi:hypothetical protein
MKKTLSQCSGTASSPFGGGADNKAKFKIHITNTWLNFYIEVIRMKKIGQFFKDFFTKNIDIKLLAVGLSILTVIFINL